MNLAQARRIMPPADGRRQVRHPQGDTRDIVEVVVEASGQYVEQVQRLAQALRGRTHAETARNVWHFIRSQVQYVPDGFADQDVKSPARMLADGYGDCKSYTVMASSIFRALEVPHVLRFTSYRPGPVTHVYTAVGSIPVDPCYNLFPGEKPFRTKFDIKTMARVSILTGIGSTAATGWAGMLEGDAEAALVREQAELERKLGIRKGGILASDPDVAEAEAARDRKNREGLRLVQVAPDQADLANEAIATISQSALYFLLLFIKEPEVIAALPKDAAASRAEAVEAARYYTQGLGMSDRIFMKIIRNSIMKQTNRTPEQILAEAFGLVQIAGIGAFPLLATLLPTAINAVKKGVQVVRTVVQTKKAGKTLGDAVKTALPNISKPRTDNFANTPTEAKKGLLGNIAKKVFGGKPQTTTGPIPAAQITPAQVTPEFTLDPVEITAMRPEVSPSTAAGSRKVMPWILGGMGLLALGGVAMYASNRPKPKRRRR